MHSILRRYAIVSLAVLGVALSAIPAHAQVVIRERVEVQAPPQTETRQVQGRSYHE
ncbi:MAG: hypothetical protein AAGK21_11260 [Bacteroidota bacterium]